MTDRKTKQALAAARMEAAAVGSVNRNRGGGGRSTAGSLVTTSATEGQYSPNEIWVSQARGGTERSHRHSASFKPLLPAASPPTQRSGGTRSSPAMAAAVAVETRQRAKRTKAMAEEKPPPAGRRPRQPTPDHPPYCWVRLYSPPIHPAYDFALDCFVSLFEKGNICVFSNFALDVCHYKVIPRFALKKK
jgi:hypothetical protein